MLKISFFHTNTQQRDVCSSRQLRHWWHSTQNKAKHRCSAASVHRRHKIARHATALTPHIVHSSRYRSLLLGDQRSDEINTEGWLSCMLDKQQQELCLCIVGRWKIRHRSHALRAVACESEARHSSTHHWSSLQHRSIRPNFGHTHGHYHWLAEVWMCLQQTLWCNIISFFAAAGA